MKNYLKQNMSIRAQYDEALAEQIQNEVVPFEYTLIPTKSGDVTLGVSVNQKQVLVHSKYDPQREALQYFPKDHQNDPDVLILGGFGLGYLAEAALIRYEKAIIVVVEKEKAFFHLSLLHRDLAQLLSSNRFHILFEENDSVLIELLKTYKTRNIHLMFLRSVYELYIEYYKQLREKVYAYLNSKDININTLSRFQKVWTRNVLNNCTELVFNKGIRIFKDQFLKIPCIIVAGGPSLNKNIHLLKTSAHQALIIACNTVVQPLQNHGIQPDFVVVVDPQDLIEKYFQNVTLPSSIIVCEPSISHKIITRFPHQILMVSSVFAIAEWLEQFGTKKGSIEIGGSVATAAYGLASLLGCDPIIFIGQDLAYSQKEIHTKGTYFEQNWFYEGNRYQTYLSRYAQFMKKIELIETKGYFGESVYTDRKFEMFRWWFESKFAQSNRTIIDATEGGCHKEHTLKMSLQEALDAHCTKDISIKKQLVRYHLDHGLYQSFDAEPLKESLHQITHGFAHLLTHTEKAIALANELYQIIYNHHIKKKPKPDKINRIIKQLNQIDSVMMPTEKLMEFVSLTIQKTIYAIEEDQDIDYTEEEQQHDPLKIARKSLYLYTALHDAAEYNLHIFKKAWVRVNLRK